MLIINGVVVTEDPNRYELIAHGVLRLNVNDHLEPIFGPDLPEELLLVGTIEMYYIENMQEHIHIFHAVINGFQDFNQEEQTIEMTFIPHVNFGEMRVNNFNWVNEPLN